MSENVNIYYEFYSVFCVWVGFGFFFLFLKFKNTKMHSEIYSHSGRNAYIFSFGKMIYGSIGSFHNFLPKYLGLVGFFLLCWQCFGLSRVDIP